MVSENEIIIAWREVFKLESELMDLRNRADNLEEKTKEASRKAKDLETEFLNDIRKKAR